LHPFDLVQRPEDQIAQFFLKLVEKAVASFSYLRDLPMPSHLHPDACRFGKSVSRKWDCKWKEQSIKEMPDGRVMQSTSPVRFVLGFTSLFAAMREQ
jgi:hypothetical protein